MTSQGCQTICITNLSDLEESRRDGLLVFWEELMAVDPKSTFYQGPAWCMEWYRSYGDFFSPLVMLITCDRTLVGIVPMAVESATGRLTFATDNMADYRDVVTRPDYRKAVIAEMLQVYKSGSFPNTLRLGPTQPESKTVGIVRELTARTSELRTITRAHTCWRFWFNEPTSAIKIAAKESVRRNVNYYKREGPVVLQRVKDADSWDAIKDEFFAQHSLRQLSVGRPISFNEERKRRFYDGLIEQHPEMVHVTMLRVAGKLIAGHYGYIWRKVLYWGASSFDVREEKHSPGQILVALFLQNASTDGLRGVDFTLGTEEFKARFGNSCASLPTVEIYSNSRSYFSRKLRDQLVSGVKAVVMNGAGARKSRALISVGKHIDREAQQVRESGLKVSLARWTQRGLANFTGKNREQFFIATAEEIHFSGVPLAAGEIYLFRTNEIYDLLKCADSSHETVQELAATVKRTSTLHQGGRALHTILVNDSLAAWGWSHLPEEAAVSPQSRTQKPHGDTVVISGMYVVPQYRQRQLDQILLSYVLKERFESGARTAYILCSEANTALRKALERTGFREDRSAF
jgi:CelD/BcsL family acetyltransferase involved in cellulose biosynthesis